MSLSDKLKMINSSFSMMLSLVMLVMISPAQAQAVSCDSSSPQCCWVVRIWELMGKTTSVSSTSSTACCSKLGTTTQTSGITGVTCTSTGGTVTKIDWNSQSLQSSIPPDIGNLVNLTYL
jgi:hypothetical protein